MNPAKQPHYETRLGVPTFLWTTPSSPEEAKARSKRLSDPEREARRHLARYASFYGLKVEDIKRAKVSGIHNTGRGGVIVKFREEIDGIEVFREEISVMMDRNLERIAISGYLSGAQRQAQKQVTFRLDERQALAVALKDRTGIDVSTADLANTGRQHGPYTFLGHPGALKTNTKDRLTEPAAIQKVFFHLPGHFEPAYFIQVTVESEDVEGNINNDLYAYVISAIDGNVLFRNNLTVQDNYSYRVWAETTGVNEPLDSPNGSSFTPHPTGNDDGSFPPFVLPNFITLQNGPISTNDPWLPSAATETVGNNVDAYADLFTPDGLSGGDFRASTTGPNAFDRTYDVNQQPGASSDQRMASITQLFYNNNFLHDFFYDAGFNEAAGNAQTDNFGRGGLGNDSIRAEAQDFSGRNNANMSTPDDGLRPRMQMFVFDGPAERTLTVNSQPPGGTLPGVFPTERVGRAVFGPQSFNITADVVAVDDGTAPNTDACQPIVNNVAGKIAFVDRGGPCAAGFVTKVQNAQNAGAVGIIIANVSTSGNPTIAPTMGGTCSTCTIGAFSLNFDDGNLFRNTLPLGTVNATMFRPPTIDRDGTIDNQIVAHEWGHYLSNRLIATIGTNQARGMGEGWSDFVGQLLTVRPEDASAPSNPNWNGVYPFSTYVVNDYYFGIRRFPYSTDMTKNPLTFKHIANGNAISGAPCAFGCDGSNNAEVHNTGEIWASMLWECFAALLRDSLGANPRLTFDEARLRMRDYLVASLKMTPTTPTFTEARDAVLAAAAANDLSDYVLFCEAFAKRGIGIRAVAPDRFSSTNTGVVESFLCGNDLQFVSASLGPAKGCDNDPYLDNKEKATLTVTLKNVGRGTLSNTTGTVTSDNPFISFSNEGLLTFPPSDPFDTTTATIKVSMKKASGIQEFYLDISAEDSELSIPGPLTFSLPVRGNANETPNLTATDTVEPIQTSWTFGGFAGWIRDSVSDFNHVWLGLDSGFVTDAYLISPVLNVAPSGDFSFTFNHRFDLEPFFDGGVIEISNDGGASWTDIGAFASPGYTGTIANNSGSPIGGRQAYTGTSTGYPSFVNVTVNLGTTYQAQNVQVRFRIATDLAVSGAGWEIDDITFSNITNKPFFALVAQGPCK